MFSSDRDHEEFHQNRYKFNVHAHFTKLNDIEDLSKNNAMRPDNCVVSSEKWAFAFAFDFVVMATLFKDSHFMIKKLV